jgi:outer membrane receptor for ferrienterochelin and colicin
MLKGLPVLAIALLSSCMALGQGSIAGHVKDAKTGEAIIGANVVIKGTETGAATDLEGNFQITGVSEGTYSIQVSFVTYKTHVIPDVRVETAKRVTLDIVLSEDISELEEVVVTAARQVDTDYDLLKAIKENKLVVSGISAQQISRTLDRDAAQVIRRVPGVTIRGNEFVNVRGLGERYNVVMLHNAYAPSVETDIRSFSFSIIPSSQLDQMLVFKSPAADLPGDFAGGVIKIFTKNIPEENGIQVDYSFQIRSGTTFKDFHHQQHNKQHFTGVNTGFYDLPSWFPADLRKVTGNSQETAGKSLKNLWTEETSVAIPDQRLALTFNHKFKIGSVEIGNITAINYSNARATYNVKRSDFNGYDQVSSTSSPIYIYNDNQYNQYIRTGILFNWAFRFSDSHQIEFKNLLNQNSTDQFVERTGINFESGVNVANGAFDKSYRGIYSGQLVGHHKFFGGRTMVEWLGGYNHSNRNQPDYKRYRSDIDVLTGEKTLFVPVGAAAAEFLGRFYSDLIESSISGGISVNHQIAFRSDAELNPAFKAGMFYEVKDREFAARNIGYVRASSSSFDQSLLKRSIGELFAPQNINNTTGVKIDEQSNPSDNYSASNKLLAVYGVADVPVTERLKTSFGVRVENNTQSLRSASFTNDPINVEYPITSVLPSANMSFNLTDASLIRVAYGKTVNRPEFRELAPFGFYDFNFNFTNKGNPNLTISEIQNVDLRWEYYPGKLEVFNVGFFYKSFRNPIETVFNPGSGSLGAKSFTYQNAQSATNYGIEVELKKSLKDLTSSRIMDRLSVLFNGALIRSNIELGSAISAGQSNERPLQGQAPYIVNAGLFYDHIESGLQINALYNVVGKNIAFVGFDDYPDLYLMPRHQLDLTVNKRVSEKIELKFGVSDILNQDMFILQDGDKDGKLKKDKDQQIQKFKPGQLFSAGISMRL